MKRTAAALCLVVASCGGTSPLSSTDATAIPSTTAPAADNRPVALAPSSGVERAEPSPDAPVAQLAAGLNQAGFELLRRRDPSENVVFSPLSVGHALLMARSAADDPTRRALDTLFAFPPGRSADEAWNALERAMSASAEADEDLTVAVADRMWPRLDLEVDQEWIDLLAAEHGVTLERLDFAADPDGSRQVINRWVEARTEGLIPELLPDGFVHDQTVLVLTDAIYFEAGWERRFGKYPAESGEFTRLDGSTVTTTFMHELELGDRRGRGEGYAAAEVPYVGGDYSMLLVVPEPGRYEEMRDRLGAELLEEIDSRLGTGPYELFMPRWDTHTQFDFFPWLVDEGVAPGSFPAMGGAFLDGAVHGADISVDEEGTVAAAATGLGFAESGPPEPELTIRADRPFFYLIRHRPTGAVLFAGQVTDPTG